MNFSIGKKLSLGFGVLLFCILAYGSFVLFELGIITSGNMEYVKRSGDEMQITLASRLGPFLYETIAGTIINSRDPGRQAAWEAAKTSALAEMAGVAPLADTQAERDWAAEAGKDLDGIIRLFEDKLIPALANGATTDETVRLDSEMTGLVSAMDSSLDKLKNSLSSDKALAEKAMLDALSAMRTASLLVSLLLLCGGIAVAIVLTRLITRPLRMAVDLALAIAEGDLTRGLDESYTRAKDETGALAGALNKMASRMREAVLTIQGISGEVAEGSVSLNLSVQQLSQGTAGLSTSAMQLS
ncbi:MAG TPA: methyl-accepting chemotaxis protein, partial [Rectinemataceae bacterium]|nr:methyl-accepting chemotaxis protein [Rectinemataceae bacterium]